MAIYSAFARYSTVALLMAATACGDLEVTNPNAPDAERALASGEDVKSLLAGAFQNWYFANQNFTPAFATGTMADHFTASWGNFGMRNYSSEPRIAFVNSSTDGNIGVVNTPWYGGYAGLVAANLTLVALLENGVQIGANGSENKMVETGARFIQGAVLADMSMFFDKAYVVDETSDPTVTPDFTPRGEVRTAALAKLDQAIALAGANSFTLPSTFLSNTFYTNTRLAQMANTIAARAVAYHARNAGETGNSAVTNWTTVLNYASKGVSSGTPISPYITGDFTDWWDPVKYHADEYVTWTRVDQRVVCMMDPAQPCRYPDSGTLPAPNSPDKRLGNGANGTDFLYLASVPFNPARGRYHFSHIGHKRYYSHARNSGPSEGLGDVPFITAAENDLLWAEALVRTNGDKALAAAKINNTRVTRGGLAPMTAANTSTELLNAIFYERDVELWAASANVPFYDMRRTDRIQTQTPRHFPVPAGELEVRGDALYTFGGANNPAGMSPPSFAGFLGADFPGIEWNGQVVRPSARLMAKAIEARKQMREFAGMPRQ